MSERITEGNEGNVRYVKPKECKAGETVVKGEFVESYTGSYGLNYKFREGDGTVVIGHKNLDKRMAKVSPGDKIEIVYLGKKLVKSGQWKGKETHAWDVLRNNEEVPF